MDLLAAGVSLVVGLHFLPLARLFRFPVYYASGIAIILCDLLSWALLRFQGITFKVGVATGTVLWVTAIYALPRTPTSSGAGGGLRKQPKDERKLSCTSPNISGCVIMPTQSHS